VSACRPSLSVDAAETLRKRGPAALLSGPSIVFVLIGSAQLADQCTPQAKSRKAPTAARRCSHVKLEGRGEPMTDSGTGLSVTAIRRGSPLPGVQLKVGSR
jgi:hypothetical protein